MKQHCVGEFLPNRGQHFTRARNRGAISPSTGRTLPDRFIEGTCPICGYAEARERRIDGHHGAARLYGLSFGIALLAHLEAEEMDLVVARGDSAGRIDQVRRQVVALVVALVAVVSASTTVAMLAGDAETSSPVPKSIVFRSPSGRLSGSIPASSIDLRR